MISSLKVDASSFLLGAVASLSVLWTIRSIQNNSNWRARPQISKRSRSPEEEEQSSTHDNEQLMDAPDLDLRLIRKAEAVIRWRTSDLVIVVERCQNDHNYSAILRTAEALGIQHVYMIDPPEMTDGSGVVVGEDGVLHQQSGTTGKLKLTPEELEQRSKHRLFAQNATEWLTLHEFATTSQCLTQLKKEGYQVWATDLSQVAVPLERTDLESVDCWPLPARLALVFGTEAVGCSQEMLDKADMRVYLPLRGYADSLNLSVATALVIHHIFLLEPGFIGSMSEVDRRELRQKWFSKLACQRLLTSGQKRKRKKLQSMISYCEKIQAKQAAGGELQQSQLEKLAKCDEFRAELAQLEDASSISSEQQQSVVANAVADLVRDPPPPLTDVRRADTHRVSFIGKGTKKTHAEYWKGMVATSKKSPLVNSTSGFFRSRVRDESEKTSSSD